MPDETQPTIEEAVAPVETTDAAPATEVESTVEEAPAPSEVVEPATDAGTVEEQAPVEEPAPAEEQAPSDDTGAVSEPLTGGRDLSQGGGGVTVETPFRQQ